MHEDHVHGTVSAGDAPLAKLPKYKHPWSFGVLPLEQGHTRPQRRKDNGWHRPARVSAWGNWACCHAATWITVVCSHQCQSSPAIDTWTRASQPRSEALFCRSQKTQIRYLSLPIATTKSIAAKCAFHQSSAKRKLNETVPSNKFSRLRYYELLG